MIRETIESKGIQESVHEHANISKDGQVLKECAHRYTLLSSWKIMTYLYKMQITGETA